MFSLQNLQNSFMILKFAHSILSPSASLVQRIIVQTSGSQPWLHILEITKGAFRKHNALAQPLANQIRVSGFHPQSPGILFH